MPQFGPRNFELLLNIDFTKNSLPVETQLVAFIDQVTYQDKDVIEDFPVWIFGIGPVCTSIDEIYSSDQLSQIVKDLTGELSRCYLVESGQWK